MRIFVINLDRDTQRWEKIYKALTLDRGIPIHRLSAVDCKKLNRQELSKYQTRLGKVLPLSAMACYLSHRQAWEMALRYNEPVMILEDDAKDFVPNFLDKAKECLTHTPKDAHLLLLGCMFCDQEYCDGFSGIVSNILATRQQRYINQYVQVPAGFGGTHAYIITPTGAKYCLGNEKISFHLDMHLSRDPNLCVYRTNDKLCTQDLFVTGSSNNASGGSLYRKLDRMIVDDGNMGLGFCLGMNLVQIREQKFTAVHLVGFVLLFFLFVFMILGIMIHFAVRRKNRLKKKRVQSQLL